MIEFYLKIIYSILRRILELVGTNWTKERKYKWWPVDNFNKACGRVEAKQDRLTFSNIGGVFVIICVGILCSCIALYIEFVYFKHKLRYSVDPNPGQIEADRRKSNMPTDEIHLRCGPEIIQRGNSNYNSPYNWKRVQQRMRKSLPHLFAEVHHDHGN